MEKLEEKFYEIAALEIAQKSMMPGVFAKAFSDAAGDENLTLSLYIKYRVNQLSSEFILKKKEEEKIKEEKIRKKQEERRAHEAELEKSARAKVRTYLLCTKCATENNLDCGNCVSCGSKLGNPLSFSDDSIWIILVAIIVVITIIIFLLSRS